MKQTHVPLMRRRREGVTDYRSRKKAVASQRPLLVVRVSNKNVSAQFITPRVQGDAVVSSSHSKELAKLGWHGSPKSTPACYLLGMLAAKKAIAKGVKEAVVYNGTSPFIRGSRVAAFLKGAVDGGLQIPVGEGVFPTEERIAGKSIADYASKLSSDDAEAYKKAFSGLLKAGFDPAQYPASFEKAKAAIAGGKK